MKRKILAAVCVAVLGVSSFGGVANAASYSEPTSEFGTFRATLSTSGKSARGTTTTTKSASSLYVNVEIQENASGKKIAYDENRGSNTTYVTTRVTSDKNYTLACFSCHEARGNSSVVKYFADTL